MSDWFPKEATISPERSLILDLITICKKQMAQNRGRIAVLQLLSQQGQSAMANSVADAIQAAAPPAQDELDALFRLAESDLTSGREYQQNLRSVLSKLL